MKNTASASRFSDLAGFDIEGHGFSPDETIQIVRNWLSNALGKRMYGAPKLQAEFQRFEIFLESAAVDLANSPAEVTYTYLCHLTGDWIQACDQAR